MTVTVPDVAVIDTTGLSHWGNPNQKGRMAMKIAHRDAYRKVVFFAVPVAIAMTGLCVTDLLASYPYQPFMGQTTFSITYTISSVIILYMCWQTWHDLELGDGPGTQTTVANHKASSSSTTSRSRNATPTRRSDKHKSQDRASVS